MSQTGDGGMMAGFGDFLKSMFARPQQAQVGQPTPADRPQNFWNPSDTGLQTSGLLGALAQAIDPKGAGGRIGGTMANYAQSQATANAQQNAAAEQRRQNLEMMKILTQTIGRTLPQTTEQGTLTTPPVK